MWSNLYCCSVSCAFLAALVCGPGVSYSQELSITPEIRIEPIHEIPLVGEIHGDVDDSPAEFRPVQTFHSGPGSLFSSADLGTPGTLDRLHSPIIRQDLKINSAQSCAAASCHGGPRAGILQTTASRGMEYQVWVENDPHAQSWRTICNDESVAMMRRLKIMEGNEVVDQVGFDNCLACHNTVKRYSEPRVHAAGHAGAHFAGHQAQGGDDAFLREGVGCAGCHGPSERWIGNHYQYHWSPEGASSQGFVEAGDLYVRARMCASCHIGDKDRDMNHDIIAAGHPTLRYELATFHAWQPKHWRDPEANDKTFYEAQLWLAGQVAAVDASLALLHSRSADTHTVSQWPEFAAYDCASCHHNLGLDNGRRGITDARRATAIYSQWNDSGLRWVVNHRVETGEATQEDFDLLAALDAVKVEMETKPKPSPEGVTAATSHAREALAQWFDGQPGVHERHMFRSDRLGQVVASAAGKSDTFRTWESAVQFYLAAVAARESWPGGWNGPLRNVADRIQSGLRYPDMIDVSRYAKRDGNRPTATRVEATSLGIELAGWLGPVNYEPRVDETDEFDGPNVQAEIEAKLKQIEERWRNKPLPERPDVPEARPAQPPREARPDQKPEGQSIEDLRRSLEQLQSGSAETDN